MKAIGGYFELADYEEGGLFPHQDGVLLNTGRNALEYILRSIGDIKHIYLPYYTCEVVLEPIEKLHIPYTFYHIDQHFEIVDDIRLKEGEYLIVNNYFGIKDAYIQLLAERYGGQLIVDCAQAFFAEPIQGIKAFYSPRKYVGVADGGVAYLGILSDNKVEVKETERTREHDSHLLKRKQFGAEAGFADYQANEKKLNNQPIRWMSDETKRILCHIDFGKVTARRRANYYYLQETLGDINELTLPDVGTFACPMVYPYLSRSTTLKQKLIDNKIFVATYWPNVKEWCEDGNLESSLAQHICFIPIDQRYGEEDVKEIIDIIK